MSNLGTTRKAATVSIWIWIIGGLVIGILTFTAAYYNLSEIGNQAYRQNVVTEFNNLNEDIGFICSQATGAQTSRKIKLRDVRAIFASDTKGEPPATVPVNISNQNISTGQNVCLTFVNDHYACEQQQCQVAMTFIGRPFPGSDMFKLGSGDRSFEFDLTLRKNASGWVEVEATHIP